MNRRRNPSTFPGTYRAPLPSFLPRHHGPRGENPPRRQVITRAFRTPADNPTCQRTTPRTGYQVRMQITRHRQATLAMSAREHLPREGGTLVSVGGNMVVAQVCGHSQLAVDEEHRYHPFSSFCAIPPCITADLLINLPRYLREPQRHLLARLTLLRAPCVAASNTYLRYQIGCFL